MESVVDFSKGRYDVLHFSVSPSISIYIVRVLECASEASKWRGVIRPKFSGVFVHFVFVCQRVVPFFLKPCSFGRFFVRVVCVQLLVGVKLVCVRLEMLTRFIIPWIRRLFSPVRVFPLLYKRVVQILFLLGKSFGFLHSFFMRLVDSVFEIVVYALCFGAVLFIVVIDDVASFI